MIYYYSSLFNFSQFYTDPCFTKNVIDTWKRSVANEVTDSSQICDVTLSEGWYRVISGAGELMPTVCPVGGFRCGTTAPYWLSSSKLERF